LKDYNESLTSINLFGNEIDENIIEVLLAKYRTINFLFFSYLGNSRSSETK